MPETNASTQMTMVTEVCAIQLSIVTRGASQREGSNVMHRHVSFDDLPSKDNAQYEYMTIISKGG